MNSETEIPGRTTEELKALGINTRTSHFKKWQQRGYFNKIDHSFLQEVREYWKNHYGKSVDPTIHLVFMNAYGRQDKRLIPEKVMRQEIFPIFNDYDMSPFYRDKNLYDINVRPARAPVTLVKNINGYYMDGNHQNINIDLASKKVSESSTDLIMKPSNTNNGKGIIKLSVSDGKIYHEKEEISFHDLAARYQKNFLVQEAVQQHLVTAKPHPSSVNTLRMVTFRWKGEIRYLMTYIRLGGNNEVTDNTGEDRIRLGLTDDGEFLHVGINKEGKTFTHHPTTNVCFADLEKIPNFEEFKQFAKDCHKNILHLNIISWDIIVATDGKPMFLEANFAGVTSFYQLAVQQPFFGDLTEEVLEHVRNERKVREPVLMSRDREKQRKKAEAAALSYEEKRNSELESLQQEKESLRGELESVKTKLQKEKDSLKDELKAVKAQLEKAEQHSETKDTSLKKMNEKLKRKNKEISSLTNSYQRTIESKSWRYTKPLRFLLNTIKK